VQLRKVRSLMRVIESGKIANFNVEHPQKAPEPITSNESPSSLVASYPSLSLSDIAEQEKITQVLGECTDRFLL